MKILWVFELQPTERVQVSVQLQDHDDDDDDDDGGDDETLSCLDTQPLGTLDGWWKRCVGGGADGTWRPSLHFDIFWGRTR